MKYKLIPLCVVRLLLVHKLNVRDTDSPHLFPASLVSWYFPLQKPPCRNFLISLSYLLHRSSGVTMYLDSFHASKMVRDIGALWYPDVTQTLQRLGFEVHINRWISYCIPFETKPFLPSSLSLTLVNEKSERTGNGSDSSRILSIFLRFLPGVVNYMTTRRHLLVQRDGGLVQAPYWRETGTYLTILL